jgi:hypothetical protein
VDPDSEAAQARSHVSTVRVDHVATAIKEAALCWRCIALKAGVTPGELDDALTALRRDGRIRLSLAACEGCERDTLLYRAD